MARRKRRQRVMNTEMLKQYIVQSCRRLWQIMITLAIFFNPFNRLLSLCNSTYVIYGVNSSGSIVRHTAFRHRFSVACKNNFWYRRKVLHWMQTQLPDMSIANLSDALNDGVTLCALLEKLNPGCCPRYDLLKRRNRVHNCRLALNIALKYLKITKWPLSPIDIALKSEERTVRDGLFFLLYLLMNKHTTHAHLVQRQKSLARQKTILLDALDANSNHCICSGEGLKKGMVNAQATFTIELFDQHNTMNFTSGSISSSINMLDSAFGSSQDKDNDVYVQVDIYGPCNDTGSLKIVPSTMTASQILNFSDSFEDSAKLKWQIGAQKIMLKNRIQRTISHNESSSPAKTGSCIRIKHKFVNSGRILVMYTPVNVGCHTLNIKYRHKEVKGSPYTVIVEESKETLKESTAAQRENNSDDDNMHTLARQNSSSIVLDDNISFAKIAQRASAANASGTIIKRRVIRKLMVKDGKEVVIHEQECSPTEDWPSDVSFGIDPDNKSSSYSLRMSSEFEDISLVDKLATATVIAPSAATMSTKFLTSKDGVTKVAPVTSNSSIEFDAPESLSAASSATNSSVFSEDLSAAKRAVFKTTTLESSPQNISSTGIDLQTNMSNSKQKIESGDAETLHYVLRLLNTTNKLAELKKLTTGGFVDLPGDSFNFGVSPYGVIDRNTTSKNDVKNNSDINTSVNRWLSYNSNTVDNVITESKPKTSSRQALRRSACLKRSESLTLPSFNDDRKFNCSPFANSLELMQKVSVNSSANASSANSLNSSKAASVLVDCSLSKDGALTTNSSLLSGKTSVVPNQLKSGETKLKAILADKTFQTAVDVTTTELQDDGLHIKLSSNYDYKSDKKSPAAPDANARTNNVTDKESGRQGNAKVSSLSTSVANGQPIIPSSCATSSQSQQVLKSSSPSTASSNVSPSKPSSIFFPSNFSTANQSLPKTSSSFTNVTLHNKQFVLSQPIPSKSYLSPPMPAMPSLPPSLPTLAKSIATSRRRLQLIRNRWAAFEEETADKMATNIMSPSTPPSAQNGSKVILNLSSPKESYKQKKETADKETKFTKNEDQNKFQSSVFMHLSSSTTTIPLKGVSSAKKDVSTAFDNNFGRTGQEGRGSAFASTGSSEMTSSPSKEIMMLNLLNKANTSMKRYGLEKIDEEILPSSCGCDCCVGDRCCKGKVTKGAYEQSRAYAKFLARKCDLSVQVTETQIKREMAAHRLICL